MTPSALRRALRDHPQTAHLASEPDPERLAHQVEAAAAAEPALAALRELAHRAAEHVEALAAVQRQTLAPAGIRADALVRWDAWSITFEGIELSTGSALMVRSLRPSHRGPRWRRALHRDAEALRAKLGDALQDTDSPVPAVWTRLPGPPLDLDDRAPTPALGLRAVLGIVADLRAHEQARLGTVDPDDLELRDAQGRPRMLSLAVHDQPPLDLRHLARRLGRLFEVSRDPDELVLAARMGDALPHDSLDSWQEHLLRALAADLTARRHAVARRERDRRVEARRLQLRGLITRLQRVPPPPGTGRVSYDLEGRPTALAGDGTSLVWHEAGGPPLVVAGPAGLQPQLARRLLRARASDGAPRAAPADERAFLDAACRWLAASLALHRLVRALSPTP